MTFWTCCCRETPPQPPVEPFPCVCCTDGVPRQWMVTLTNTIPFDICDSPGNDCNRVAGTYILDQIEVEGFCWWRYEFPEVEGCGQCCPLFIDLFINCDNVDGVWLTVVATWPSDPVLGTATLAWKERWLLPTEQIDCMDFDETEIPIASTTDPFGPYWQSPGIPCFDEFTHDPAVITAIP